MTLLPARFAPLAFLRIACAVGALLLGLPGAAHAATTLKLDRESQVASLVGAGAETSRLEITTPAGLPFRIVFSDVAGIAIDGDDCTQDTPTSASCTLADVRKIDADLGAGADALLAETLAASIAIDVDGGPGDDELTSGAGLDMLNGGAGDDELHAGGGADVLDGGTGRDLIDGGAGVDLVTYASRTASIRVGIGGAATDGEPGERDDVRPTVERLTGGSGQDVLTGTAGDNELRGGGGNDMLIGGSGNDRLFGGAGSDSFVGGAGADLIDAGPGNDTVDAGARPDGGDIIRGGAGADVLTWARRTSGVRSSPNNAPDDGAIGERDNIAQDFETVRGGRGNDQLQAAPNVATTIFGGPGSDSLLGGARADRLDAGAGSDRLYGFSGADVLLARDGTADLLAGGPGRDAAAADSSDMVLQCEVARSR